MKADLPQREPAALLLWEKEKLYESLLSKRKGAPSFILHDGPPYANGHLHMGHALNKILKDMILRFKSMAGFYAPYVPGWDCHGLPIELQLMKDLKVDKHHVDRKDFRQKAGEFAQRFVDIQRTEFQRMGIIGDWQNPYITMDENYKKVIVESFEKLKAQGYIYRGKKPVYWCATDETALAEAEVEYEDDKTPAIYVTFPGQLQLDAATMPVEFVIWTTTPWTLPSNVAIAVSETDLYVLFKESSGRVFVVADQLLDSFNQKTGFHGDVLRKISGAEIAANARNVRHPWIDRESKVYTAEFVTMDSGTGLVHIAPGHGTEDFQLGQRHHLAVISPVDDRGLFTEDFGELKLKGQFVFKTNPIIIEYLRNKGRLLKDEELSHSYPHCWRCRRAVIFRATEQWFLNVDHNDLRQRLQQAVSQVEWIPQFGRNRIAGMVASRPDWCLSRQRLWGTEIPESTPGKDPDILDVWFESGVSWAAVLKQRPELHFPADLYLEGSDQHRGWFQTSLIPAVALEGHAPYKAVLTHGFVVDGEGRKMSKSVGNVSSPQEVIKNFGADILRLWVAASDYADDVRLSPEIIKGLTETYRKVRNTMRYMLGNLVDFDPSKNSVPYEALLPIDRWMLHVLQEDIATVRQAYEKFEFHHVVTALVALCSSTLSGLYLDILKDRLYCEAANSHSRRSAQTVLWEVSSVLIRLWAPILAFTSDEAWRSLGNKTSVALTELPVKRTQWSQSDEAKEWTEVWAAREKILGFLEQARQTGQIKGNLEAKVLLFPTDPRILSWFNRTREEWPTWLIVSQVEIATQRPLGSEPSGLGFDIAIQAVDSPKCARCWIRKVDVGALPNYADLCGRCAAVVQGLGPMEQGVPA